MPTGEKNRFIPFKTVSEYALGGTLSSILLTG
jgi:hypothetical protein